MQKIRLSTQSITDWNSFHLEFKQLMGFPGFYGMNMDAWIDCMSYLNDSEARMTGFNLDENEQFMIEVPNAEDFKQRSPEIFDAFLECVAFVNQRYVDSQGQPVIALLLF